MAFSKAFVLQGLLFAVLLILSKVSGREIAEAAQTPEFLAFLNLTFCLSSLNLCHHACAHIVLISTAHPNASEWCVKCSPTFPSVSQYLQAFQLRLSAKSRASSPVHHATEDIYLLLI